MDTEKLIAWIGNIEFEDGEKLSLGSVRTLGDIKQELRRAAASPVHNQVMQGVSQPVQNAEWLARMFHGFYESMAPDYGYETREETRKFNPESTNGRLMIAVCSRIIDSYSLGK